DLQVYPELRRVRQWRLRGAGFSPCGFCGCPILRAFCEGWVLGFLLLGRGCPRCRFCTWVLGFSDLRFTLKDAILFPTFLPLLLNRLRVIVRHGSSFPPPL